MEPQDRKFEKKKNQFAYQRQQNPRFQDEEEDKEEFKGNDRGRGRGRGNPQMNQMRQNFRKLNLDDQIQQNQRRNEFQQNQSFQSQRQKRSNDDPKESFYSYKTIEGMNQMSDENLITKLYSQPNLSATINNTKFTFGLYSQLIRLLHKVIMSNDEALSELQNKILISFMESKFFQTLDKSYLSDLYSETKKQEDYVQRLEDLRIIIETFDKFMNIFRSRINHLPIGQLFSFITTELELLADKCDPLGYQKVKVQDLNNQVLLLNKKKVMLRVEEDKKKDKREEEKKIAPQRNIFQEESYKQLPPNNYQTIPVIPTKEELFEPNPFLRAMPVKGQFRNTQDYLDCVYRLLREDAIQPIRKGIQLLSKRQGQLVMDKQLRDLIKESGVRLFMDARVNDLDISTFQGQVTVTFRISDQFLPTNWIQSKKLLSGSLVVLSPNNFREIFIGIVRERDGQKMSFTAQKFKYVDIQIEIILETENEENLRKNDLLLDDDEYPILVQRNFVSSDYQSPLIQFYQKYKGVSMKLIESTAYFEAYSHVLKQLKEMGTWPKIPFQEYFTNQRNTQIPQPKYYNQEMRINPQLVQRMRSTLTNINLDPSQNQALNQCLQKELAIIQGPPGTGKTFVGDIFAKILLENKTLWKKKGPILLVCYTNHALDQFLIHVKKYTQNVLRIGGRCNNPELKENTLSEFCRYHKIFFDRGYHRIKDEITELTQQFFDKKDEEIQKRYKIINSNLKDSIIQSKIYYIKNEFKSYLNDCLYSTLNQANQVFLQEIFEQILILTKKDNDLIIMFWLEIIDLRKLIQFYAQQLSQDPEYLQNELEDLNLDDVDQRLLENDLGFLNKNANNITLKQKIEFFNSIYQPRLQSNFYGQSYSIEDCIKIGNSYFSQQNNFDEFEGVKYFKLTFKEKWILNNELIETVKTSKRSSLDFISEKLKQLFKEKKQLTNLKERKAFQIADLVAMTTTGCAKNADLLKSTTFPIVIVEEAAEVFEGHILTTLSKKTEHLILIGDHQQLRPNPAVYELDIKYNLSMSLFERLVKNNFEYVTLSNQRRMRPEISKIIKLIYSNLQDSQQVMNYPDIRGISTNLFFLDHQKKEDENKGLSSKYNDYEAQMITRFVFYLLQQKYKPEQITVLSLYQAQSLHLKKTLQKLYKKDQASKVKVITVDNYQGEENDIIILSLVRSNASNNIGYLKISNRVCVALSRAKHGMFIFGNANCLINAKNQNDDLWKKVLTYLRDNDFIGQHLKLQCNSHKKVTEVKEPEDFQKVPEGGCKLKCGVRIQCGHACDNLCHYYQKSDQDPDGHKFYKCIKQCQRVKSCKHNCTYICHQCKNGCKPCLEKVTKKFAICGHENQVKCSELQTALCHSSCEKVFQCGHKCKGFCYEDCSKKLCKEQVLVKLPCGHEVEKDCYLTIDEFIKKGGCYKKCKQILECGHQCPRKCGECQRNYFHGQCSNKCQRDLICGHICQSSCTKNCPGCNNNCETKCVHSKCNKKCKEICTQCVEPCYNQCEHSKCTRLCFEPCNKKPCYEPCKKILNCKHLCVGLCGDPCPKICRQCSPNHEAFQTFFGTEDENSRFVMIDCGHFFEVESLDHYMSMKEEQRSIQFKKCPRCSQPIKKTVRYQSIINQVLCDIIQVKQMKLEEEDKIFEQYSQIRDTLQTLRSSINQQSTIQQISYSSQLRTILNDCNFQYSKLIQKDPDAIANFQKRLQLVQCLIFYGNYLQDNYFSMTSIYRVQERQQYEEVKRAYDGIINAKFMLSNEQFRRACDLASKVDSTYNVKKVREMVVSAMGLSAGHFYKCPNGHIYAIGECGGAMQESKCPDCGEKIGGTGHNLREGNRFASEMGGSRPAWDPRGFDARVMRGEINLNRFA